MAQRTVYYDDVTGKLMYKKGLQSFPVPSFGIDDVLAKEQKLTKDRVIEMNGNRLHILNVATDFGIFLGTPESTIYTTAQKHLITGRVINPQMLQKDFPDDATAATNGVESGEDYHNAGDMKVRII